MNRRDDWAVTCSHREFSDQAEHRNNGSDEYLIGSADLMNRNLESRVEVLVPIRNRKLQDELRELLDLQLNDQVGAWEMDSDGALRREPPVAGAEHSQTRMLQDALSRSQDTYQG